MVNAHVTYARSIVLALGVAGLLGCGAAPAMEPEPEMTSTPDDPAKPAEAPPKAESPIAYLSPSEHLTRASLALRGQRPSLDELQAVRDDKRYVEAIVDYYLTTPEFGATMRELHAESLLIGVDPILFPAGFPAIGALAGRELQALNQSIIEAPLRLIEHVISEDLPYSEIVTADYTLADDVVATVWGLPYDASGTRWQKTHYGDRPSAGILSDSFLFTRHSTTFSNKSRGRANLVSRALLCYDFLSREIPLDSSIDLADPDAVSDAVRNNPACASCHQTLDPLASHFAAFYPIYVPSDLEQYPFNEYEPAFSEVFAVTDPGFFGSSSNDLVQLGANIAEDPRFSLCAAERFYSFLAQVPLEDVPQSTAAELQGVLIDSGMNAKALAKAVVMSDGFRVSYGKTDEAAEALQGLKKARPSQLANSIEALTGYRWRTNLPIPIGEGDGVVGEVDLMDDAFFGFKVLAGGMDSNSVTRPSYTASATVALTLEGLASRAANFVVDADFRLTRPDERRLLTQVEPDDEDPALIRVQLAELSERLYGEAIDADSDALDAALELFFSARQAADGDGTRAWKLTLFAMLQDVRMLYD